MTLVACVTTAALAAAMLASPVTAQQGAVLPAAPDLMTRFVDAIGGRAAIEARTSSHFHGKIEVPAQGITGTLEVLGAAPDKFLLRIEITGIGTVLSGYDGKTGWSMHPAMGPMVLDGRMLDQMKQEADFYQILHPERYFTNMETVGRAPFGGRSCYKVSVATRWGEEYHQFYDAETGLFAGSIRNQATPMGDIETTTVVSDYKPMGGMLIGTKIVQQIMGMEQVMTLTTATFDTVDPAAFALPAAVETLVNVNQ